MPFSRNFVEGTSAGGVSSLLAGHFLCPFASVENPAIVLPPLPLSQSITIFRVDFYSGGMIDLAKGFGMGDYL